MFQYTVRETTVVFFYLKYVVLSMTYKIVALDYSQSSNYEY